MAMTHNGEKGDLTVLILGQSKSKSRDADIGQNLTSKVVPRPSLGHWWGIS